MHVHACFPVDSTKYSMRVPTEPQLNRRAALHSLARVALPALLLNTPGPALSAGELQSLVSQSIVSQRAPTLPATGLKGVAAQLRGKGDNINAWDQPWSTRCAWSSKPPSIDAEPPLPPWLEGEWRVTSKLEGVSFPLGRTFLTDLTPGARMASILPLPNVGNAPAFELSFGADRPRRADNARSVLEAFWPDATVVSSVEAADAELGRLQLTYEAPTRSRARVSQSIDARACSAEGGLVSDDEWVGAEVWLQSNVEQGVVTNYLLLTSYRREPPGANGSGAPEVVRSKQRVAAFLQPTDGRYMDASGRPVALYDYAYTLTRKRS